MYYNTLAYGLAREIWIVLLGVFLNMLGYGAVLPFEILYLHDARGFGLGTAGLVVGTVTGVAVVVTPFAGALIDRIGARATAAGAGIALAGGYAGLAFAGTPFLAFAAAAAAGIGNGALSPAQSTLIAALTSPDVRHRATAVSRVAVNVGIGLGGAIGGIVAAYGVNGFVVLLLANSVTYVVYVAILVGVVREPREPARVAGGYRTLWRDRPFVRLAVLNVAFIAVGWGVLAWIVPPYAAGDIGVGPRVIGLLLFANALTVVVAQIPAVRLAEGRRRAVALATASLTWVAACLLVVAADLGGPTYAVAALLAAAIAFGIGECFHSIALMPLVAELAPEALRGRYMATMGLSWWLGLALAPTLGAQLLSVSAPAALLAAGGVALSAGVAVLALERELPAAARLTPRPVLD